MSGKEASRSPDGRGSPGGRSSNGSLKRSPSPRAKSRTRSPPARSVSKSVSRSRSRSGGKRRKSRSRSRSPKRKKSKRSSPYRSRSRSPYYEKGYSSKRRSYSRSPGPSNDNGSYKRRRQYTERDAPKPSRCLGVFGLNLRTQERDLRDLFAKFGTIEDIQMIYDHNTGQSRGFAFIYMKNMEDAIDAKEELVGKEVDGHNIRIDYSLTKRAHTPTPGVYMGRPSYGYGGGGGGGGGYSRRSPSPYYGRRGGGGGGGGGGRYSRSPSPRRY